MSFFKKIASWFSAKPEQDLASHAQNVVALWEKMRKTERKLHEARSRLGSSLPLA